MHQPARITFVTGTDTGVGKTILTCLITLYLRSRGVHALAMKPFCTGTRHDVQLLAAAQNYELQIKDVNPVYFPEPLAPFVAARKHRSTVKINNVLKTIRSVQTKCQWLVIEGIGGVYVPLTRKIVVADLVSMLNCETIVVARNRLGTINHTLLTVDALKQRGINQIKVVLAEQPRPDHSSASNPLILKMLLHPLPVYRIAFLGPKANKVHHLKLYLEKIKKVVAQLLG